MADSVTVTNMPNSGSREAVALELWKVVRGHISTPTLQKDLDLFKQCLNAAYRSNYDLTNVS